MNRCQSKGWRKLLGTVALRAGGVALLYLATGARDVHAYPMYDDGQGNGCVTCHSTFKHGNPSVLHVAHRTKVGITQCNFCHPSGYGTKPVFTYWSGPGGGYGCAGCHGNDYGETSVTPLPPPYSSNSNQAKATGYGLRKAHGVIGEIICAGCHFPGSTETGSPDPAPPIKPETDKPPYYKMPGSKLTDPCDSSQEAFTFPSTAEIVPDTVGLDNDGNGLADFPLDPACFLLRIDPTCALPQHHDPNCS